MVRLVDADVGMDALARIADVMNVKTRVTFASNATAARSYIRSACSSNKSGTPIGASGTVFSVVACFSAFWMRVSISRTLSR